VGYYYRASDQAGGDPNICSFLRCKQHSHMLALNLASSEGIMIFFLTIGPRPLGAPVLVVISHAGIYSNLVGEGIMILYSEQQRVQSSRDSACLKRMNNTPSVSGIKIHEE
jgi:hypothetical protein